MDDQGSPASGYRRREPRRGQQQGWSRAPILTATRYWRQRRRFNEMLHENNPFSRQS